MNLIDYTVKLRVALSALIDVFVVNIVNEVTVKTTDALAARDAIAAARALLSEVTEPPKKVRVVVTSRVGFISVYTNDPGAIDCELFEFDDLEDDEPCVRRAESETETMSKIA